MIILFLIGIVINIVAFYVLDHNEYNYDLGYICYVYILIGDFLIALGIFRGIYLYLMNN